MDGNDHTSLSQQFEAAAGKDGKKTLRIDVERYQHMLDKSGLTEAQKRQALEALWSIVVAFVDLGFRIEPLEKNCGKVSAPHLQGAASESGALESEDEEKD